MMPDTDTQPRTAPELEAPYGSPYPVEKRIAEITNTRPNLTLVLPGVKLDRRLTPNGRAHWAVKNKLAQASKKAAFDNLKALLNGEDPDDILKNISLPLKVTFARYYSGRAKPFDDDNLTSAWKAMRDGVALCMRVDDNPKVFKGIYQQERCNPGGDRLEIRIEL